MNTAGKKKMTLRRLKKLIAAGIVILTTGCSSSADIQASIAASETDAFPTQFAVASPFASEETASVGSSLFRALASPSAAYAKVYDVATAEIDLILAGASPTICSFRPEDFLVQQDDASCYGPRVDYQEHPEGSAGNSGELPPGDVGLWEETDADTGKPCAVAEYDAQMDTITQKSRASLMGLASMVCVVRVEGYSMPSSSVLDLTADMNALTISGVTFSNASLGHNIIAGSDQYTYNLAFEYDDGTNVYDIVVDMTHVPGSATGEYEGQMSYTVSGANTFGGNCPESDSTINASLQYRRGAADAVSVRLMEGRFCGANVEGRDASGIVDPSLKYPADADGWSDDFNIFTAEYDANTLDGNYSYSWQAGALDNNTRVFNLRIETDATTSLQNGHMYFGFGDDAETTDGGIDGFICNWAGPGSSHALDEFAQYQAVTYDAASNSFTIDDSKIDYAPTTSCDYAGADGFIFDTDGDDNLADETDIAVTNELEAGQDLDGDAVLSIEEVISDIGFSVPSF